MKNVLIKVWLVSDATTKYPHNKAMPINLIAFYTHTINGHIVYMFEF